MTKQWFCAWERDYTAFPQDTTVHIKQNHCKTKKQNGQHLLTGWRVGKSLSKGLLLLSHLWRRACGAAPVAPRLAAPRLAAGCLEFELFMSLCSVHVSCVRVMQVRCWLTVLRFSAQALFILSSVPWLMKSSKPIGMLGNNMKSGCGRLSSIIRRLMLVLNMGIFPVRIRMLRPRSGVLHIPRPLNSRSNRSNSSTWVHRVHHSSNR